MSAILPTLKLNSDHLLVKHFMPHQVNWIEAEDPIHAAHKQVFALAEKSVRIGWTVADAFKNVRKRLRFPKRDYLYATKDFPSALEYMKTAWYYAELFDLTCTIVSHGEESLQIPRLDRHGRSTGFTEEVKVGLIKFDNGSRIIAFSASPHAMAVYEGDVGLDEFAKHPNADLLWETAQGRVTWGFDIAVWSAHNGDDTLFFQFAQQARAACQLANPRLDTENVGTAADLTVPDTDRGDSASPIKNQNSKIEHPATPPSTTPSPHHSTAPSPQSQYSITPSLHHSTNPSIHPSTAPHSSAPPSSTHHPPSSPWNLYYRVTMPDAIELGLLDVINRERRTRFTPQQFLADCQARAGQHHIYEQTYLCNPVPGGAAIVDWSAIERCRYDYPLLRLHLEHDQIIDHFGEPLPHRQSEREHLITDFIRQKFLPLFSGRLGAPGSSSLSPSDGERAGVRGTFNLQPSTCNARLRLGFDVAASGQGDLAAIYIDQAEGPILWLRALFTCRTEDWHFLQTVLHAFMRGIPSLQAAGDESGLGRQICWEAAQSFGSRFLKVNFSSKKHDLGFALMNQLTVAEKRFPRSEQDVAADFFALRRSFIGKTWVFTETRNTYNPASHCDIAWAGALASHAHTQRKSRAWALAG